MTWVQRFRLRHYIAGSLWIVPTCFVGAAVFAAWLLPEVDRIEDETLLNFDAGAAEATMAAIAGSMIVFTGFVFSVLLMALQFASAQLSPRIIRIALASTALKFALGCFIFTFAYAVLVLEEIRTDFVPQLSVTFGIAFVLLSLYVFLLLLHDVATRLSVPTVVSGIGAHGQQVIERAYPRRIAKEEAVPPMSEVDSMGEPSLIVRNTGKPGVVQAIDVQGLVAAAQRADCVVGLVPAIGDFVTSEDPVITVYGPTESIDDEELRASLALGTERTLEQDPLFAFRILVDIGAKALSPSVNDPTSAVSAIDQIHNLLYQIGTRRLDEGMYRDDRGSLRLMVRRPTWDDFVDLGTDELRQFGEGSFQVVRRIRAMLEDLIEVVPPYRRAPLEMRIALLERGTDRGFRDQHDRLRAKIADRQGVGSTKTRGTGGDTR